MTSSDIAVSATTITAPSDLACDAPALHTRLGSSDVRRQLSRRFRERGWVRIDSALAPGLAAELSAFIPGLALAPHLHHARAQLSWRCTVGMPASVEPQYPACMFRVARLLQCELPPLFSAIAGVCVLPPSPVVVHVHAFRKGSYMDEMRSDAAPSAIEFSLGLTGAMWPQQWGGYTHLLGSPGHEPHVLAPGWDTLDVFGACSRRMPIIRRHVQAVAISGALPVDALATPGARAGGHAAP